MSGAGEKMKLLEVDFVGCGQFVEVGANYLKLADDTPAEALRAVFGGLRRVANSIQWLAGDFFCQVASLRGDALAQQLMAEWDVSYSRASAVRHVCALIPADLRVATLSFSHHEQAIQCTDTVAEALQLLQSAAANRWSVAQMRRGAARALSAAAKSAPGGSGYRDVYALVRRCEQLRRAELDETTRRQLKSELRPLVEFWEQL